MILVKAEFPPTLRLQKKNTWPPDWLILNSGSRTSSEPLILPGRQIIFPNPFISYSHTWPFPLFSYFQHLFPHPPSLTILLSTSLRKLRQSEANLHRFLCCLCPLPSLWAHIFCLLTCYYKWTNHAPIWSQSPHFDTGYYFLLLKLPMGSERTSLTIALSPASFLLAYTHIIISFILKETFSWPHFPHQLHPVSLLIIWQNSLKVMSTLTPSPFLSFSLKWRFPPGLHLHHFTENAHFQVLQTANFDGFVFDLSAAFKDSPSLPFLWYLFFTWLPGYFILSVSSYVHSSASLAGSSSSPWLLNIGVPPVLSPSSSSLYPCSFLHILCHITLHAINMQQLPKFYFQTTPILRVQTHMSNCRKDISILIYNTNLKFKLSKMEILNFSHKPLPL